jgi:hypothetical protein
MIHIYVVLLVVCMTNSCSVRRPVGSSTSWVSAFMLLSAWVKSSYARASPSLRNHTNAGGEPVMGVAGKRRHHTIVPPRTLDSSSAIVTFRGSFVTRRVLWVFVADGDG